MTLPPPLVPTRIARRHAAAFLDRDGVVNLDFGYVYRPEDLAFTPTAVAGIALLNAAGIAVIVVTNQSGVARGLFTLDHVARFHAAMQERLADAGARIDAFYCCPYHPDGHVAPYAVEHEDRKPNPGMLLRAIRDRRVDPARSVLIGDKDSDIEAAARAGVPGRLVASNSCDLAGEVRAWLARTAP